MSGAAKEIDSAQRIGTMLEEQMNRIAQIEEDWHKIDNGSSHNDTQHSMPVGSDAPQGSSGQESSGLEHGEVATSDDSNENDKSQESSVLEQIEVATSGGSNDDHQHVKSLRPDSCPAVDHVLIGYDENPIKPNQRELDENGNLIPLPPATPPPEAPNSPDLPPGSAEKVVDPCAQAADPSSDSTVNPTLLGDSPLSATYRSRSVKGSLRRPCRISKALKAAEVAGESLGVQGTPQDTQVIEGIVIGPSNATQAVSCEPRPTEIKAELVGVADLGMSNGFDKSGDVAEIDVPRADDMVKRNHEIDSGEGRHVEDGNMHSQHPRDDTSDKAEKVGDTAVSDVPKTADMAKGLNIENENTEAQHPEGDNGENEKPDDTTGSDVPKTDEMVKGDDDTAGIDLSEPDDVAKGHEDTEGSDVPEPDDIAMEDHDVESDSGWDIEHENLEAQYPGKDHSAEADETAVSGVPKVNDMANGRDDVESDRGLEVEDENMETQHTEEDIFDEEEKPSETAVNDVSKTDDIHTGHDDIESGSGLDVKDWILWAQYSGEDVSDKEEGVSKAEILPDRAVEPRGHQRGDIEGSDVPKTNDIESDSGLDIEDGGIMAQYSGENVSDNEARPRDTVGSDVPKTEDHVEEQDDVEGGSGLNIEAGSMEQHPREDVPDKEEGPSNMAGSDAPKTENMMEEHEDVKNCNGLDIKNECMEARSPENDGSNEGKKPGDKVVTDMLVDEGVAEEQVMTGSHEGSDVENEETAVQHPRKIHIAGAVDVLQGFASRGLALLMVAKGFEELGGVGNEQKAVEPPVAKKVDVMVCCNQSPIERGLALLMEAMDASLGI